MQQASREIGLATKKKALTPDVANVAIKKLPRSPTCTSSKNANFISKRGRRSLPAELADQILNCLRGWEGVPRSTASSFEFQKAEIFGAQGRQSAGKMLAEGHSAGRMPA